jgi:response regulator RpfG family c-di-GMP phosphodiesterase
MLANLTLLYVEDSKIMQKQTYDTLKPLFEKIIIADDGQDGLNKYLKHILEIDVIVSDIVMPNMTGLEMIAKIRKIDQELPCILATSIIDPNAFLEAIKLQVTHYAIKPFEYDILIEQIEKACLANYQQKLLKQKLIEEEQYLSAIDGVAIISRTDTKGIITYVNSKFCEVIQKLIS